MIVLFTTLARRIDWSEVFATLADFKVRTLIIAAALTVTSFITYACFDLIGRTYIRQKLGWRQILPVGGDQLRVQPQPQRLGRWHRHALSAVFAAGGSAPGTSPRFSA
nr:hypothetical protein GCM10020185_42730 [Pseudomonas brassicacearum subsp. brassicacearum]